MDATPPLPIDYSDRTRRLFAELFHDPFVEMAPPRVRLSVDATIATPALATMIGEVLAKAGAIVTYQDGRVLGHDRKLEGLHVHIGQLTWVREEEADRWAAKP